MADERNEAEGLDLTRWRTELMSYFRNRLDSAADAEDLTQKVLAQLPQLWQLWQQREIVDFRSYVFRTARNALIDLMRSHKRDIDLKHAIHERIETFATDDATSQVAEAELRRLLNCMTPEYRLVLLLHEGEGLTLSQIAERMGISKSSAGNYYQYAFEELQQLVCQETAK